MRTPYAPRMVVAVWLAAGWVAISYGVSLTVTALRSPPGAQLTGRWVDQAAFELGLGVFLLAHLCFLGPDDRAPGAQ